MSRALATYQNRCASLLITLLLGALSACAGHPLEPLDKVADAPTPISIAPEQRGNALQARPVIPRAHLNQVLAEGPGRLLQRVQLIPYRENKRFVGFQITTLFPNEGWSVPGVQIGDVISRVNGLRVDRPEQFMHLFESLATAQQVDLELVRNGAPIRVVFPIE